MKYYPLFLLALIGCKDSKQVIYIEQPIELEVEVIQVRENILPGEHKHVIASCPEDMHIVAGSGCLVGGFEGRIVMIRNSANVDLVGGEPINPQVLTEWICSAYNPAYSVQPEGANGFSVEAHGPGIVSTFAVCQDDE